jgi:hypothetical protein
MPGERCKFPAGSLTSLACAGFALQNFFEILNALTRHRLRSEAAIPEIIFA